MTGLGRETVQRVEAPVWASSQRGRRACCYGIPATYDRTNYQLEPRKLRPADEVVVVQYSLNDGDEMMIDIVR